MGVVAPGKGKERCILKWWDSVDLHLTPLVYLDGVFTPGPQAGVFHTPRPGLSEAYAAERRRGLAASEPSEYVGSA